MLVFNFSWFKHAHSIFTFRNAIITVNTAAVYLEVKN